MLTRQLQERLDAFLIHGVEFGLCDEHYAAAELIDKADARLFRPVQRPEHCHHHLLPDTVNNCSMELKHRHSFPFLSANITCIKTRQRLFKYV